MSKGTGISFATALTEEPGSGGGTPADPTASVQFNDAGKFGGSADFTFESDGKGGDTFAIGQLTVTSDASTQAIGIDADDQTGEGIEGTSITITGGKSADSTGGFIDIVAGDSDGASSYGGEILVKAGAATNYSGGSIILQSGAGKYAGSARLVGENGSVNGGGVVITAGDGTSGYGGDLSLTVGSGGTKDGLLRITNADVANGTVACVLTAASGPTGAQTAVQGWLKITIGGTDRFIPFW